MSTQLLRAIIVIWALVLPALPAAGAGPAVGDIDGDGRIGLPEIIRILQEMTDAWEGPWPDPGDVPFGQLKGAVVAPGEGGDHVPVPRARVGLVQLPGLYPVPWLAQRTAESTPVAPDPGLVIPGRLKLYWTFSDENGVFGFERLSAGHYLALATKPGFQEPITAVTVVAGETVGSRLAMLPKSSCYHSALFGQVLGPSPIAATEVDTAAPLVLFPYFPVAGVEVRLYSADPAVKFMMRAVSDKQGRFFFFNLQAGEYIVRIDHPGHAPVEHSVVVVPCHDLPILPGNIEAAGVSPGCICPGPQGCYYYGVTATKVVIKPAPATDRAALSGTVHAVGDAITVIQPIAGARVTAVPDIPFPTLMPVPLYHTVSDENGHYRFDRLPVYPMANTVPACTLRVAVDGFEVFEERVELTPGQETVRDVPMIPLTEPATLSGHVFAAFWDCSVADCGGLPGVTLHLSGITDSDGNRAAHFRARTDERGFYEFPQVPAGDYRLTAHAEGFEAWQGPVNLAPGQAATQTIELVPLITKTRLHGQVTDASLRCIDPAADPSRCIVPVPGAEVVLFGGFITDNGIIPRHRTVTGDDGGYAFKQIPGGRYHMTVRAEGFYAWNGGVTVIEGRENRLDVRIWPDVNECSLNNHCPPGTYCAKAAGDCDGEGTCLPRPDACYDLWAPVCGCDGVTYSNDCDAAAAGASVAYEGECGGGG